MGQWAPWAAVTVYGPSQQRQIHLPLSSPFLSPPKPPRRPSNLPRPRLLAAEASFGHLFSLPLSLPRAQEPSAAAPSVTLPKAETPSASAPDCRSPSVTLPRAETPSASAPNCRDPPRLPFLSPSLFAASSGAKRGSPLGNAAKGRDPLGLDSRLPRLPRSRCREPRPPRPRLPAAEAPLGHLFSFPLSLSATSSGAKRPSQCQAPPSLPLSLPRAQAPKPVPGASFSPSLSLSLCREPAPGSPPSFSPSLSLPRAQAPKPVPGASFSPSLSL